ncbi:MAG: hypothetical protein FWC23_09655 [Chitinispirillia bacterium]|nr:hypothetical protein [Chitinispirillia bacterium]MCL2269434.1 hypothetical protein [Chitinispirillia bacterium]
MRQVLLLTLLALILGYSTAQAQGSAAAAYNGKSFIDNRLEGTWTESDADGRPRNEWVFKADGSASVQNIGGKTGINKRYAFFSNKVIIYNHEKPVGDYVYDYVFSLDGKTVFMISGDRVSMALTKK